jgi:hypothetical protein
VFGLTCIVSLASAQTAPIRSGSFELGGFMGSTYNVSQGAIMGGANLSYAVTKIFLPYIEYSYFPSIGRTGTGTTFENDCGPNNQACTFSTNYTTHAIDFHGGVHIRIPIRETRFAPYGVFGIGVLGVGSGTINGYQATDGASPTVPVAVHLTSPKGIPGTSGLAINFGGGVRYYVTPSYGFRVEVKGYKPVNNQSPSNTIFQSISITNTFLKAEVGFFYQFR